MAKNMASHARDQKPAPRARSSYVDNIKSYLTALVVYHHTAASYGGEGEVPYRSAAHPRASSIGLVQLNALNQSYFMGSFFYISGYFSRRALQRKGTSSFVRERLYRLGLPTLAYSLLGPPTCRVLAESLQGHKPPLSAYLHHWRSIRGVRGPVWFTATLLCFDLLYAAAPIASWRGPPPIADGTNNENDPDAESADGYRALAVASCAAVAFLARLYYPVGTTWRPLGVQVAYLPQYVLAYLYGTSVSDIGDVVPSLPLSACLGACTAVTSTFLVSQLLQSTQSIQASQGGWNYPAAAYAVWNETTGYLLTSIMVAVFRRYATRPWGRVGEHAYAAFLVHMPVSVVVGSMTDSWQAGGWTKTAVVGTLSVVASWLAGAGLTKAWSALGGQ